MERHCQVVVTTKFLFDWRSPFME